MRKQYTTAFKATLVLELLKESKSLSQPAAEHHVHLNQLRQWRNAALKELPTLTDRERSHHGFGRRTRAPSRRTLLADRTPHDTGRVAQKNLVWTLSRDNRVALIDREADDLSLAVQADLLGQKPRQPVRRAMARGV